MAGQDRAVPKGDGQRWIDPMRTLEIRPRVARELRRRNDGRFILGLHPYFLVFYM